MKEIVFLIDNKLDVLPEVHQAVEWAAKDQSSLIIVHFAIPKDHMLTSLPSANDALFSNQMKQEEERMQKLKEDFYSQIDTTKRPSEISWRVVPAISFVGGVMDILKNKRISLLIISRSILSNKESRSSLSELKSWISLPFLILKEEDKQPENLILAINPDELPSNRQVKKLKICIGHTFPRLSVISLGNDTEKDLKTLQSFLLKAFAPEIYGTIDIKYERKDDSIQFQLNALASNLCANPLAVFPGEDFSFIKLLTGGVSNSLMEKSKIPILFIP
jgi:hypothetical protein